MSAMMTELAFASWETIARRSLMIARGKCSPAEYFANGAGKDVGRERHGVGSRAVVTDFGLDYVAGALARPGEGKCAATAPKVIYKAPTAASHSKCSE